jgi:hypothetical protein
MTIWILPKQSWTGAEFPPVPEIDVGISKIPALAN